MSVVDKDKHYIVDENGVIVCNRELKNKILQHSHNSERLTFEVPRFIEGYDLMKCSKVEIHYINGMKSDIYTVSDVEQFGDDYISFSWLVSGNATRYAETLYFSIVFTTLNKADVEYCWVTRTFDHLRIIGTTHNTEPLAEDNSDLLEAWKKALEELATSATRGMSAYEVAVKNGFVGTEAEWLASLKGANGLSAYEIATKQGFTGDINAWLASLIGETGKGVKTAEINANGDLVLTYTDNQTENVGKVKGENGNDYVLTNGDKTEIAEIVLSQIPVAEGVNF